MRPVLLKGVQPGGQLMVTTDVENYPGFGHIIQGPWLMQEMETQAQSVGAQLVYDVATSVDFSTPREGFRIVGEQDHYVAKTVIIATGAQARWLGLPSEETFRGFGVSACATCDAFFCRGKVVYVVGGGNTAVEEALFLARFAQKVYLVHRRDVLRAEKILQKRLEAESKIEVIWNSAVCEILGQEEPKKVTGIVLENIQTHTQTTHEAGAVFIAIGHDPVTAFLGGQVACDTAGYITTGHWPGWKTSTSVEGVFAAGDVADPIYRQAVTAAGMGCMAALDAERYCHK